MDGDRLAPLVARLDALAPGCARLEQVCRGSVTLLDVSGAAVILMAEQEPGALTASFGARVAEVEDLQFALGEGPCLEAHRQGAPVFVPDLSDGHQEQWSAFAVAAVAMGARAVFVLPLQLGAIRLGVLYLYRDQPGMLSPTQIADALDLAELAVLTALDLQRHATGGWLAPGLEGDWAHRAAVHQATGMVSAQLSTDLTGALLRIRGHAAESKRSIYTVAADIISGRLRLNTDGGTSPVSQRRPPVEEGPR
jgi:hypothetical protein